MDRRSFFLRSLIVFAASRSASAQQTKRVCRIGFLGIANASSATIALLLTCRPIARGTRWFDHHQNRKE
jgi:hypothetical protein